MRPLTAIEARVLAVLVEKERTVPETYPMSINALVGGCNQKSNRAPVMECTEADVASAIDGLRSLSLVTESSGAKVLRYGHNVDRALRLPSLSVVLLAVLMLRGQQTAAELRLRSERMHRFADVSSVEGFLDELAARSAEAGGPLVCQLPRRPGEREARWTHLLCGVSADDVPHDGGQVAVTDTGNTTAGREDDLSIDARIARLEARVHDLTARFAHLQHTIDAMNPATASGVSNPSGLSDPSGVPAASGPERS